MRHQSSHEPLFKSPGSHDDRMFECSMVQAAYLHGRPSVVCDLIVILPIPCMRILSSRFHQSESVATFLSFVGSTPLSSFTCCIVLQRAYRLCTMPLMSSFWYCIVYVMLLPSASRSLLYRFSVAGVRKIHSLYSSFFMVTLVV